MGPQQLSAQTSDTLPMRAMRAATKDIKASLAYREARLDMAIERALQITQPSAPGTERGEATAD
jgi:hypothetical protein